MSTIEPTTFSDWRTIFREDARRHYLSLRDRLPSDTICAFAYVVDDDCIGMYPVGDTSDVAMARKFANKPESVLERLAHDWAWRWNTSEWENKPLDSPYDESEIVPANFTELAMAFREKYFQENKEDENAFRAKMHRTMIDALCDLDAEGLFGQRAERKNVVLFLENPSSDFGIGLKLYSTRMLNSWKTSRRLTTSLPLPARIIAHGVFAIRCLLKGPLIAWRSPSTKNG